EYADLISAHRAVERIAEAESEISGIIGLGGDCIGHSEAFRVRHGPSELQHARRILRLDWICCAHKILSLRHQGRAPVPARASPALRRPPILFVATGLDTRSVIKRAFRLSCWSSHAEPI